MARGKSILQKEKECFLTGSNQMLDVHHIFNGALRNFSDEEGLWVYLNHDVHMWLHQTGVGRKKMMELKKIGQQAWEMQNKNKYEDVHEEWMKKARKNYV